jgi:hypothetical protein
MEYGEGTGSLKITKKLIKLGRFAHSTKLFLLNDELYRVSKQAVINYFQELSNHLSGRNEHNHETLIG